MFFCIFAYLYSDINECAVMPSVCKNNGVCNDSPGSFTCDCSMTGYTGPTCITGITSCNNGQFRNCQS